MNANHPAIKEASAAFEQMRQAAIAQGEIYNGYTGDLCRVIEVIENGGRVPMVHFFLRKYVLQYFGYSGDEAEWFLFLKEKDSRE